MIQDEFVGSDRGTNGNIYEEGTKTLYITNKVCLDKIAPKELALPLRLHEFAHSVFSPNLEFAFRHEFESNPGNHIRYRSNPDFFAQLPPDCRNLLALVDIVDRFSELLADTATVLVLEDPKAMAKALSVCVRSPSRLRDFSRQHATIGWKASGPMLEDPHTVLNPARSHIWNVYVSRKTTDAEIKPKIIVAAVDASVSIIQKILLSRPTREQWNRLNLEGLNRDFIREFDQQLKNQH